MRSELIKAMTDLDDLLEVERTALLAGDLEKLSKLMAQKEAVFEVLNAAEHADLQALQTLDHKVKRNQHLLGSALEGIRAVARRMAAFRRVHSTLETYNARGTKRVIEIDCETSVEKRA